MSVDYRAVVAIGKEFYSAEEAKDFLHENLILTYDDLDEIETNGLGEWLDCNGKVCGECLDCYSDNHYYVGYDISCTNPEAFERSFVEGMKSWKSFFPNVEPDMIKTVKVY